jgi:hypothetical protein
VALLTFVLFTGVAQSVQAQTFKVGDYVEYNGSACTVASLQNGHYSVSCGAVDYFADAPALRARAATAEDKGVEAETAAALARQATRTGNSLGAQFGTREPATCASRTAPARGTPSADQARQYFVCDKEVAFMSTLSLVTNVKVQVSPSSHPPNQLVYSVPDIDQREPVWDIRGSFTQYSCNKLATMPGWPTGMNAFARAHTCSSVDQPTATGACYKSTFGDWHCSMLDAAHLMTNIQRFVLPPSGN